MRTIMVVWLLLAVFISACGSVITPVTATLPPAETGMATRKSPSTSIPSVTPTVYTSTADLNGVKIRFFYPWSGNVGSVMAALVNEFNISNDFGIFVEATGFGSNNELVDQVWQENGEVGTLPNVVAAPASQLYYWITSGLPVIDLQPYIYDQGIGLSNQEVEDIFVPFWQESERSGMQFGIPAYRTAQVVFYNQSWAQELGFINPPVSTEEFMAQACAAAQFNAKDATRANDGTGGWIIDTSWQSAYSWLAAYEYSQYPVDDTGSYVFAQPQAERMLEAMRQFSDLGCAWNARDPQPYEYFARRQSLFYTGYLEDIPIQIQTNLRLKSADHWTVIPLPGVRNQKITFTDGQDFAVFAAAPKEQLASWLFIKWLASTKNQSRMVEASVSFPIAYSNIASLVGTGDTYPMWQQALGYIPGVKSSPKIGTWVITRQILEDAFWKSLQANTPADELMIVLRELDATIHEVLGQ